MDDLCVDSFEKSKIFHVGIHFLFENNPLYVFFTILGLKVEQKENLLTIKIFFSLKEQ